MKVLEMIDRLCRMKPDSAVWVRVPGDCAYAVESITDRRGSGTVFIEISTDNEPEPEVTSVNERDVDITEVTLHLKALFQTHGPRVARYVLRTVGHASISREVHPRYRAQVLSVCQELMGPNSASIGAAPEQEPNVPGEDGDHSDYLRAERDRTQMAAMVENHQKTLNDPAEMLKWRWLFLTIIRIDRDAWLRAETAAVRAML